MDRYRYAATMAIALMPAMKPKISSLGYVIEQRSKLRTCDMRTLDWYRVTGSEALAQLPKHTGSSELLIIGERTIHTS
jgi:hypothetical protein